MGTLTRFGWKEICANKIDHTGATGLAGATADNRYGDDAPTGRYVGGVAERRWLVVILREPE